MYFILSFILYVLRYIYAYIEICAYLYIYRYKRKKSQRFLKFVLFHRTEDVKENVLAVLLIVLVSWLGFLTLNRGFYKDLRVLLFCLVMASCQYSLLKARSHLILTITNVSLKLRDNDIDPSDLCSRVFSLTLPLQFM